MKKSVPASKVRVSLSRDCLTDGRKNERKIEEGRQDIERKKISSGKGRQRKKVERANEINTKQIIHKE